VSAASDDRVAAVGVDDDLDVVAKLDLELSLVA
jgi:hypothetical protein